MILSLIHIIIYCLSTSLITADNCTVSFYRVDNKVDIAVNDAVVYTTGIINNNPNLNGTLSFDISPFLTSNPDTVSIRLYNGVEPYSNLQKDQHWEIEYSLKMNGLELDFMWNEGDDDRKGLVFEETYYL